MEFRERSHQVTLQRREITLLSYNVQYKAHWWQLYPEYIGCAHGQTLLECTNDAYRRVNSHKKSLELKQQGRIYL
jgi:hypothetical protein